MGGDIVAGDSLSGRSISPHVSRPRPRPRHVVISVAVVPLSPLLRQSVLSLAVAVTIILGASAHAADPAEVERLLQEGIRLRREASDSRALPVFQKAHDLAHTPRTAAQLGLVEFALGYSLDAATHLSQGLAASNDIWIQTNRAVLEKSLVEVRATIGDVDITGTPPGADVHLNGKPVGRLPLASAIPSNQGPATVEMRATGYVTSSTSIYVTGGKHTAVHLELEREHNLAAVPPTTAPAVVVVDSSGGRPSPAGASPSSTRSIVGWTLVAAGAASAAVGGILLLSASDCTPMTGFQCAHEPASRVPGWTLLGAGLATGVAGAVVLVTRPTANTEIGLGPSYVFLRGRL
jgi:PEGA domain